MQREKWQTSAPFFCETTAVPVIVRFPLATHESLFDYGGFRANSYCREFGFGLQQVLLVMPGAWKRNSARSQGFRQGRQGTGIPTLNPKDRSSFGSVKRSDI